jgi:hypothetical protein
MAVRLTDPDVTRKLEAVEGTDWMRSQGRRQLREYQTAYADYVEMAEGYPEALKCEAEVWLEYRGQQLDPVFYGSGGYSRYRVGGDGSLNLWPETTSEAKVKKALAQGFTVYGRMRKNPKKKKTPKKPQKSAEERCAAQREKGFTLPGRTNAKRDDDMEMLRVVMDAFRAYWKGGKRPKLTLEKLAKLTGMGVVRAEQTLERMHRTRWFSLHKVLDAKGRPSFEYQPGSKMVCAAPRPSTGRTPVVLSYGMGVDSTAILVRWIDDPSSRDFELEDLIVLTAQTGNEFPETGRQVEQYILPLLRKHNIRFVQVARSDLSTAAPTTVFTDTRSPRRLYLDGDYKLSDESFSQGTVPSYGGDRLCSMKSKGVPLDNWMEAEMAGRNYRHVIGFNADEGERKDRDEAYVKPGRASEYPLFDWKWNGKQGWGRQAVEDYLYDYFGEEWLKSCCIFCPFTEGRPSQLRRMVEVPGLSVNALMMEWCATSFNPNIALYAAGRTKFRRWSSRTLYDTLLAAPDAVTEDGEGLTTEEAEECVELVELFEERLAAVPWGIYYVRRITGTTPPNRGLDLVEEVPYSRVEATLKRYAKRYGGRTAWDRHQLRAWLRERLADVAWVEAMGADWAGRFKTAARIKELRKLHTVEELFVGAPIFAETKVLSEFEKRWKRWLAEDAPNRRKLKLGWTQWTGLKPPKKVTL